MLKTEFEGMVEWIKKDPEFISRMSEQELQDYGSEKKILEMARALYDSEMYSFALYFLDISKQWSSAVDRAELLTLLDYTAGESGRELIARYIKNLEKVCNQQ